LWTFHLNGFDLQGAALLAQNGRLNLVHLQVRSLSGLTRVGVLF
jgi:hypothetical protein